MDEPTNQNDFDNQNDQGGQDSFRIPDEYANNSAFQGINSMDDLCKKVVNQESLIGKKYVGIPNENSSPEEISKYREAIGVPVRFEDYTMEATPEIKEAYGEDDPEIMNSFKKVMFDAGLSQKQAQALRTGYDKIISGIAEKNSAKEKAIDLEFENLVDQAFGRAKEEKINIAREFIQKNVSANMKPYLPKVMEDNHALLLLADIANNIYPNMRQEDIRNLNSHGNGGATPESVRAKMQTIIASDAFQNSRHPGNDQAKLELQEQAKLLEQITKNI